MSTAPFERDDTDVPQDKPRMWPVVWRLIWQEMTRKAPGYGESSLFRVFVTALMWVLMIFPLGLILFVTAAVIAFLGKVLHFW